MPGMGGMGKMPGTGKRAGARQSKKKDKMTPQQRAAAARRAARGEAPAPSGSSFGLGTPSDKPVELPAGLDKLLGR